MDSSVPRHRTIAHPLPTDKIIDAGTVAAVQEQHSSVSVGHNIIDQYSPLGQATIMQNSSSRLEFQIFSSRINQVKGIFLEIPITNNSGTNDLELISPYFFCSLIEILIDNNSEQEILPEGNMWAHRMMTAEQTLNLTRFSNLLNPDTLTGRDAAGANPILIGQAATRYVYLPLNNTLFEQTKVPFASISSTIRFRFTFDVFTNVTATTNTMVVPGNLAVGSAQLYIFGSGLSRAGSDEIQTALLSNNHSFSYYKQERQVINNGNNTLPGSRPKQSLTNLNGMYANIIIALRTLNPTKEKQYQWDFAGGTNPSEFQTRDVTLNDSNGSPYSLNNIGYFLGKWFAPLLTGVPEEGAKYSTFADKFSYVEFNLADDSWYEVRQGNPGGIVINNAWSIEYTVGNAGASILPYAQSTYPVLGLATETLVLADRMYSCTLDSNGKLRCRAQ